MGRERAQISWDENGVPCSRVFDDKYFCQQNGYADAVHIFCDGNDLPERFSRLDPQQAGEFTIIETGFGTGLDFCCAWQVFEAHAPASWRLRFVSLERYPISGDELARALTLWPVLSAYAEALKACYTPEGKVGDWTLASGRVRLIVVFDDAPAALERMRQENLAPHGADAFFLDGFAPSKNPGMWSGDVFAALVPLSRSGTTFATFTVAGSVRRGLEHQGFQVRKVPGHGRKNQILTGVFQGQAKEKI